MLNQMGISWQSPRVTRLCEPEHWFLAAILTALVLYGPHSASAAHLDEATPACGDTGSLPLETLGSDKKQRTLLFQQAAACVSEGKSPTGDHYFQRSD